MIKDVQADQSTHIESRPLHRYAPSWLDHVLYAIERLPIPAWQFYAGVWIILFILETAIKWHDGAYPVGTLDLFHAIYTGTAIYIVATVHYTKKVAAAALKTLRPVLTTNPAQYAALEYQLTTLRAGRTLFWSVAGAIYMLLLMLLPETLTLRHMFRLDTSTLSLVFDMFIMMLIGLTMGAATYHIVHQLRLVSRIYTTDVHIDLYKLNPLYAFSGLTARMAIFIAFIGYAWFGQTSALVLESNEYLAFYGFMLVLSVASFIWPLLGIHNLLEQEKKRLLGDVSQRMQTILDELHQRLDAADYSKIGEMNTSLDGLVKEQTVLDKLPTWPWRADTIRTLATALLVPIVLSIIQRLLQHVVNF